MSDLCREYHQLFIAEYEMKLGARIQAMRPRPSRENDTAMFDNWREHNDAEDYIAGLILNSLRVPAEWYQDAEHKREFMTALGIVWSRYQIIQKRRLSIGRLVSMRVPNIHILHKITAITDDCLVQLHNRDRPAHPLWLEVTSA